MTPKCPKCNGTGRVKLRFGFAPNYCNDHYMGRCPPCANLAQIQNKIDETQCTLDRLLQERDAMADMTNEHHDPFTQRLPVEIAAKVFGHCLPRPTLDEFHQMHDDAAEPTLLSTLLAIGQVCHRWRNIAHSSPELWTILPIFIIKERHREFQVFQDWLNRSGELPLFLRFKVRPTFPLVHYPGLLQVVTQIVHHTHRLRVLHISGPRKIIPWFFTAPPSIRHLHALDIDMSAGIADFNLNLDIAPQWLKLNVPLQNLIIQDWGNLTYCEFREMLFSDCINIFRDASNMISCKLTSISESDDPLSIPEVRNTSLQILDTATVEDFWDHLTLPALKELSLHQDGVSLVPSFRDFLGRSNCPLESFKIIADDLVEEQLIGLLEHMPGLTDLVIEGVDLSSVFFLHASSTSTTEDSDKSYFPFLGKLRNLAYEMIDGPILRGDTFLPFLASRSSTCTQSQTLCSFKLSLWDGSPDDYEIDQHALWNLIHSARETKLIIIGSEGQDIAEQAREENRNLQEACQRTEPQAGPSRYPGYW